MAKYSYRLNGHVVEDHWYAGSYNHTLEDAGYDENELSWARLEGVAPVVLVETSAIEKYAEPEVGDKVKFRGTGGRFHYNVVLEYAYNGVPYLGIVTDRTDVDEDPYLVRADKLEVVAE